MALRQIIVLLLVFLLISCQKNENTSTSYQAGVESSKSFVTGQHLVTLLLNTYFKSISDSVLMVDGTNTIDGATVTYEENMPQKITIAYSSIGGSDGYGHWRVGTYEAVTATFFNDPQGVVNFNFADFEYVNKKNDPQAADDTLRVGTMMINNLGKPNGIDNQYLVEVANSNYYYGDSTEILTFDMSQYFERVKEPGTVFFNQNDKFNIWGVMTGNTANEYIFEAIINDNNHLRSDFNCDWLQRGPATINTERFKYESIICFPGIDSCQFEMLSDSCENQYLIIIDNNPFPFPVDY